MAVRLFHTADLHLSQSEREYGFAVLEELVYHCRRLEAGALLFCGDVFDSWEDFQALAGDFAHYLRELEGLPVLMIPGNHELSGGRSPGDLSADLIGAGSGAKGEAVSPVTLLTSEPFQIVRPEGLEAEFLAVPFRRSYGDYPDWRPPSRERRWRVGLLHGVVNGLTYTGESEEEEQSVIDPDLFARLGLDYAALGHIHAGREERLGECHACYPGSARVWRKGESGPRRAVLTVLDEDGVRVEPVELKEAGVYREVTIPLDGEGRDDPDALLETLRAGSGPRDWVRVELTGFAETLQPVEALARRLERGAEGHFRKFEVDTEGVIEAEALRGHPLVRGFDARWRQRHAEALAAGDAEEASLLVRARQMALEELNARIQEL